MNPEDQANAAQAAAQGDETPAVDPATTGSNAQVDPVATNGSEPGVNQESNQQKSQEKLVPLSALQEERQRRKEAEQYAQQFGFGVEEPTPAPQVPQYPQFDNPQFVPPQEQPQVDPNHFMTREEYEFKERERQQWEEATRSFPEVANNPQLKELAEAQRAHAIISQGKYLTPMEAMKNTVELLKKTRAEGQKSAQESETIQKMGQVEGAGASVNAKGQAKEEILNTIKTSDNPDAQKAALHEFLKTN